MSITIGDHTKLTIAPGMMSSNLRRSRSGLPVLGTKGLQQQQQQDTPVKPVRNTTAANQRLLHEKSPRNKISTVFVPSSLRPVTRSESIVTLFNTNSAPKSLFDGANGATTVTVNGQHHCSLVLTSPQVEEVAPFASLNVHKSEGGSGATHPREAVPGGSASTHNGVDSAGQTSQPSSLIHI